MMTHLPRGGGQTLAPPPVNRAPTPTPPLLGNRQRLRDALAAKRAGVTALEAAWVAAAEADAARATSRDVRIDDRGTWDKATWARYLAAAAAHEPDFKPRIMRLLREIDSLEKLLAMPGATIGHAA